MRERVEVLLDDAPYGERVDLTQIGMHQDIAKAADLLPGNRRVSLFQFVGNRHKLERY